MIQKLTKHAALCAAIACSAIAGGAAAGIALAAIPADNGTISACYSKNTGAVRIIDAEAGDVCQSQKENSISWQQSGVASGPDVHVKTLTTPVSETDQNTLILNAPGLGIFAQDRCYDNGPTLGRENVLRYTNTTPYTLTVSGGLFDVTGPVAPGASVTMHVPTLHTTEPYSNTTVVKNMTMVANAGSATPLPVGTVTLSTSYVDSTPGTAVSCTVWVRAEVTAN